MTLTDRLDAIRNWVAEVVAVPVGQPNDGLVLRNSSGTDQDRHFGQIVADYDDIQTAWRTNSMARRVIDLISAFVVGDGITLGSQKEELEEFVEEFWNDEENLIAQRLEAWCDEITKAGELFVILFTDAAGRSVIRALPAKIIDEIQYDEDDYEHITRFHESGTAENTAGKWWNGLYINPEGLPPVNEPLMLHYSINKPIGAIRGESDLLPILKWLKRYERWLDDRVRLNAGMRSFLWIVYAPKRMISSLKETYATPPPPGSVLIAEKDAERWEAVAPQLNARDSAMDGRALRWMIAAGGPGLGLTDFGEADDANLATATAMKELRRRFLRRRQDFFSHVLTDITLHAYRRKEPETDLTLADFIVDTPDISPEDNDVLASAANTLADGLTKISGLLGDSQPLRKAILRLFMKFAGESMTAEEFDKIITEGEESLVQEQERADAMVETAGEPNGTGSSQESSGSETE